MEENLIIIQIVIFNNNKVNPKNIKNHLKKIIIIKIYLNTNRILIIFRNNHHNNKVKIIHYHNNQFKTTVKSISHNRKQIMVSNLNNRRFKIMDNRINPIILAETNINHSKDIKINY